VCISSYFLPVQRIKWPTSILEKARGQLLGEDGVRVHSMVLPGLVSSTSVNFSGPGEVLVTSTDMFDWKTMHWIDYITRTTLSDLYLTAWRCKCSMPDARTNPGNTEGGTVEGNQDSWVLTQDDFTLSGLLTRHFFFFYFFPVFAELDLWPREVLVDIIWHRNQDDSFEK
jgi:hypothetical protein